MRKKKLIMDIILVVLLGFCMAYFLTGNLVHEILGTLLLVGLLVHLLIRRKYYRNAFRALKSGNLKGVRAKLSLLINTLMILVTAFMLVTSIFISKDLFLFLNTGLGGHEIWRILHISCGVLMVICVFVHICLHAGLFRAIVREYSGGDHTAVRVWTIASRVIAVAAALLVLETSVENVWSLAQTSQSDTTAAVIQVTSNTETEETTEHAEDAENEESREEIANETPEEESSESPEGNNRKRAFIEQPEENDGGGSFFEQPQQGGDEALIEEPAQDGDDTLIEEPEQNETAQSLNDYLGKLFCNGCGKHCSLLSPQCGRGRMQAESATAEYYEQYGA